MAFLIVIDGKCDGVGKQTQTQEVTKRLRKAGYDVYNFSFPNYSLDSGKVVTSYLHGNLGDPTKIDPKVVSTFYTINHFEDFIKNWKFIYENPNSVIILDRWVTSNLIYQTARVSSISEKEELLRYLQELEYKQFNLPKPDLVIILDKGFDNCLASLKERSSLDDYETNVTFLRKVYDHAAWVSAKLGFDIFDLRDESGKIRSITHNAQLLFDKILNELDVRGIKPVSCS